MAPGEGVSVVSVDEAWFDLRHHLDWTRGEGTLVFIVTESRAQAESLRERSALWAQRTGAPWMRAPADDSAAIWLRRHLPQRGILWVEIWDDAARLAALRVLNEVRIRLAQPGGGCFVLCGPVRLLKEAVHEAADLWSIRSFARAVGDVVPTRADTAPEFTEAPPSSDGGYRSVWRVALLDEMRDERAAAVLRDVDRARALLPSDPVRARRLLDGSENAGSELAQVLFGLVRAEIGGVLDDVATVEMNLSSTLKHMTGLPPDFRIQVADAALSVGERFGAYDAAAAAAEEPLKIRRWLVDALGTPESRRNLSVSLDNAGRVARARGDWDAAEAAYEESLGIAREFVDSLGTPESWRDLSVSLDNAGRVARARGDWDAAEAAYEESLGIAREFVDSLGTPESWRDLSVSLDNAGRVAQARGDWDAAEAAYGESLGIARKLADSLGTPESLHDLVISLGNLADVVERLGDAERAESLRAERDHSAEILDSRPSET